uniref:fibronectin type III domain-containing protein n=1 Tax=Candidatus Electronema sp. TaxID=2698783 RepID=UPI004056127F
MNKKLHFRTLLLTGCLLALFSMARPASAQNVLAAWDFTGKGGQSTVAAPVVSSGITATAAVGSGLTPVDHLKNTIAGQNQTAATLEEALSADEYISFILTPADQQHISVSGIKIRPVSQNRTRSFALFSSQKPFASGNQLAEFTSSESHQPLRQISTEKSYLIALPGITVAGKRGGLSSAEEPLEFRLYIYGHDNIYESVGIGERLPGLDEHDLVVLGSVKGPDVLPPSAPTNLAASLIAATGFRLSWAASTDNVGVVSYEVFADGVSRGTTASTFMQLSGLTAATTYQMTVTARDAAGNVSEASAPLPVTTAEQGSGTHPNSNSRMGMNLTGLRDYSEEQPFKDVFKSARPWSVGANPNALHPPQLSYDANGWITSLNGAANARAFLMISDNPGDVYEMGQYVLLYDGQGTVAFEGPGVSLISSTLGRMVYNVTAAPGVRSVNITATTPGNHLRNIRLLPAVYEANYQENPWRPYILERWTKFKVIRFMDWMLTNYSTQVSWADRTHPEWYTYNTYKYEDFMEIPTKSGIPLELIIDLCNRLHADAWINVPHMASNDYITNMATLLRDNLNPDLKIYVEYSNECWNGMFDQARYCLDNGRQTYQGQGFSDFEMQLKWYSRRSVEIFNLFESVFGGTSRLIRTLGAQQGNSWTAQTALESESAASKTDAVAIAPYFGHEYACEKYQQVKSFTLAQFFNDIKTVSMPMAWVNTEASIDYIKSQGKMAIAYEGGQHFTGGYCEDGINTFEDAQLGEKFLAANLDPEMGNVYKTDLDKWKELGGDMYCAFSAVGNYSQYGYWGVLLSPKQNPAAAPKYQAIMQWIDDNPQ